jgi:hypothetical protein
VHDACGFDHARQLQLRRGIDGLEQADPIAEQDRDEVEASPMGFSTETLGPALKPSSDIDRSK